MLEGPRSLNYGTLVIMLSISNIIEKVPYLKKINYLPINLAFDQLKISIKNITY